ncbi:MAG: hypothetical protein EXR35_02980 [Limnohabitans sp.]|nr:hypothetical protein [Limnohabitans sp.]
MQHQANTSSVSIRTVLCLLGLLIITSAALYWVWLNPTATREHFWMSQIVPLIYLVIVYWGANPSESIMMNRNDWAWSLGAGWCDFGCAINDRSTIAMVIADQWGVSKGLINSFFLIISLIGYAVVGMVCRTSQSDQYYVAARQVIAPYNGMATAADWMSAASFIGLTGLLLADGYVGDGQRPGGLAYILGWTGGLCLLGLLFATKLNQTQSITIPEMLGICFDSAVVRWIAAWGAILCSSVYLAAQIYGIGLVASLLSGLTFELGVFLALGGVLLCSFLGGMRAVTWTQVVQCVVIVLAMLSIAVAVSWHSQVHPFVPLAAEQAMQKVNERVDRLMTNPGEVTTQLAIKNRIAVLDQKIQSFDVAHQLEKEEIGQKIEKLKAGNGPLRDLHRLEMSIAWRDSTSERLVESWKKERSEILNNLSRPVGFQAFFFT